jgi:hypothetical protein
MGETKREIHWQDYQCCRGEAFAQSIMLIDLFLVSALTINSDSIANAAPRHAPPVFIDADGCAAMALNGMKTR